MAIQKGDGVRTNFDFLAGRPEGFAKLWVDGPDGLPLFKPPFSRMTAYDMNRGETLWTSALGDGYRDHPRLAGLDLPRLGSGGRWFPLVTKTLVLARQGGTLEAFNKSTGEYIGAYLLNGVRENGHTTQINGSPMTYMQDGKQFIVISTGGNAVPSELIALALP